MPKCRGCGSSEFEKHDGYYYCTYCDTQCQNAREVVFDGREGFTTKLNISKVEKKVAKPVNKYEIGPEWTTWEAYNFILRGLTKQLIAAGASESIEPVVLQLWAVFLHKERAGFVSRQNELKPLLSYPYRPRDAKVFHGVVTKSSISRNLARKRKYSSTSYRSSVTSKSSKSQGSGSMSARQLKKRIIREEYASQLSQSQHRVTDESDLEGLEMSSSKKEPDLETLKRAYMTKKGFKHMVKCSIAAKLEKRNAYYGHRLSPKRLFALLYLALLVAGSPITLSDILRFMRDGHVSSTEFTHFLPAELKLVSGDLRSIDVCQMRLATYKKLRVLACNMIGEFEMVRWPIPNGEELVRRYAVELQLPDEVATLAVNVLRVVIKNEQKSRKKDKLPCYEGRAVGALLIALKLLVGLDNSTEYKLSFTADNINRLESVEPPLFSFTEWQKMIECRYTVLSTWHQPSRDIYEPGARYDAATTCDHVTNLTRDVHLRQRIFMKSGVDFTRRRRLEDNLDRLLTKLRISDDSQMVAPIARPSFKPSLTPDTSNIEAIIQHLKFAGPSTQRIPKWVDFLQLDWRQRSVLYILEPRYLKELALKLEVTVEEDRSREWLNSHVRHDETETPIDEDLGLPLKITVIDTKDHPVGRRSIPNIPARWTPPVSSGRVAYLCRDRGYWLRHCTGHTLDSFNSDFMPGFPSCWSWLLKVGSRLVSIPTRDIYTIVCRMEKYLFKL